MVSEVSAPAPDPVELSRAREVHEATQYSDVGDASQSTIADETYIQKQSSSHEADGGASSLTHESVDPASQVSTSLKVQYDPALAQAQPEVSGGNIVSEVV